MQILIEWIISSIVILATSYVMSGVYVENFLVALVTAVILGLLNAIVKPILVFLTLPINILTLGFFMLVINALIILIAGALVPGFYVFNFWWAMLFAFVLSIVNAIVNQQIKYASSQG